MKNRLILLATLLASVFSFAQEGEILYTDYGSGITKTFWTSNSTPLYFKGIKTKNTKTKTKNADFAAFTEKR